MKEDQSVVSINRGKYYVSIIIVSVLILGIFYFGNHHIVNTKNGIKIYPKKEFSLSESYVDMRNVSVFGLKQHKDVVVAMAANNDLESLPGGTVITATKMAASVTGKVINDTVKRIDDEYKVSSSAKEVSRISKNKVNQLDDKYEISEKAAEANQKMKNAANRFNKWIKTKD
jgi:hypothetical protein